MKEKKSCQFSHFTIVGLQLNSIILVGKHKKSQESLSEDDEINVDVVDDDDEQNKPTQEVRNIWCRLQMKHF